MGSVAESRKRGRGHAGYQKWLAPRGLGRGRGTSARDTYRPASIFIELVERLSTRGDVLLRERHLRVAKEDSLRSRTAGMSQRLSLRQLLVRLVLRHGPPRSLCGLSSFIFRPCTQMSRAGGGAHPAVRHDVFVRRARRPGSGLSHAHHTSLLRSDRARSCAGARRAAGVCQSSHPPRGGFPRISAVSMRCVSGGFRNPETPVRTGQ